VRKVDAAEWLLSMTTTPERAAATAGDLTEEAPKRGPLWFWWSLSRTTASLVWRTFAETPLLTMRVALRAFLLEVKMLALFTVILNGYIAGFSLEQRGIVLASEAMMMGCYFCVGELVARRAPGRELPASLAFFSMDQVLRIAIQALLPAESTARNPALPFLIPVLIASNLVALFAGIHLTRKQSAQARPISR